MGKSRELFDPGKILLWAEKGLESLFIALENTTEKKLKSVLKINKSPKQQKNLHYQSFDFDNTRFENEKDNDKEHLGHQRLKEIDNLENDDTYDVDVDRD